METTKIKNVSFRLQDVIKKCRTPRDVQNWVHKNLKYHFGDTVYSAKKALEKGQATCLEGAFVIAAIMEHFGYPPLVMSFESVDEVDHVIFIFKEGNHWGAIGQSRDSGLHGREPKFKTLRGLAWSYFDPYIDDNGRIEAYQIANLDDSGFDWRNSSRNLYGVDKYLVDLPHREMKSSQKRYEKFKRRHQIKGPLTSGPFWW